MSSHARREQVNLAIERGHSQRRACELIGLSPAAFAYESKKAVRDAPVLDAMKRLAMLYPRYGYRRIRIFLQREGHSMSWDRAWRLWKLAALQWPKRRPRKRVSGSRPRPLPLCAPDSVWAYDFVYDACANGQQLKCLTECLAIDVAGGIRPARVIEVLSRLVSERGAPLFLRSDNGPEFVSRAILKPIVDSGIGATLIDPGKLSKTGRTRASTESCAMNA